MATPFSQDVESYRASNLHSQRGISFILASDDNIGVYEVATDRFLYSDGFRVLVLVPIYMTQSRYA